MSVYESEFEGYRTMVSDSPEGLLQEAIKRAKLMRTVKAAPAESPPKTKMRPYAPTVFLTPAEPPAEPPPPPPPPPVIIPIRLLNHVAVIARIVAKRCGCTLDEMRGAGRRQPVVIARQMAQYIAYRSGRSSVEIGRFFNRDHSTVLHAVYRIEGMIIENPEFRAQLEELRAETDARKEVNKANGNDNFQGIQPPRSQGVENQESEGRGTGSGEAPSQCSDQARTEAPTESCGLTTECS